MSELISIDDLLDQSDSDSENGGALDDKSALEALMESDSDDDAPVPGKTTYKLDDLLNESSSDDDDDIKSIKAAVDREKKEESIPKRELPVPSNVGRPAPAAATSVTLNGLSLKSSVATTGDTFKSAKSSSSSSSSGGGGLAATTGKYLGSLEMADRREQRFISAGNKEVVSALEGKRGKRLNSSSSGGIGINSSGSIKHTTLEMLSSQLKRNASYKQHGPGLATAIHVSPKYVLMLIELIELCHGFLIYLCHDYHISHRVVHWRASGGLLLSYPSICNLQYH